MASSALLILLFLMAFISTSSAGKREDKAEILKALDEATQEDNWGYVPLSGPYVDEQFSQNISVQVDKTAVLNCRILYIVGKTVSWIRSRDLHLLTVGRFTYTSDDRFKAVHQKGSDDWLLKIHYVQHRDAGRYECQVSTTPPLSYSVYLSVVEPQTTVIGGPDLYLDAGSTLNLTCVVRFSPEPPPYIFWYHEDKLLSYDSGWQGTSVATRHGNGSSVSRLLIQNASPMHSGNYTCMPATSPQHSVNVHVIQNEEPAAIHHKNTTSGNTASATVAAPDTAPVKTVVNNGVETAVAPPRGAEPLVPSDSMSYSKPKLAAPKPSDDNKTLIVSQASSAAAAPNSGSRHGGWLMVTIGASTFAEIMGLLSISSVVKLMVAR